MAKETRLDPGEFLVDRDESGNITASDGLRTVTVAVENGEDTSYFHRVAIHKAMGPQGREGVERVFVAELDGVRLYVNGDSMILTKRDLYF